MSFNLQQSLKNIHQHNDREFGGFPSNSFDPTNKWYPNKIFTFIDPKIEEVMAAHDTPNLDGTLPPKGQLHPIVIPQRNIDRVLIARQIGRDPTQHLTIIINLLLIAHRHLHRIRLEIQPKYLTTVLFMLLDLEVEHPDAGSSGDGDVVGEHPLEGYFWG